MVRDSGIGGACAGTANFPISPLYGHNRQEGLAGIVCVSRSARLRFAVLRPFGVSHKGPLRNVAESWIVAGMRQERREEVARRLRLFPRHRSSPPQAISIATRHPCRPGTPVKGSRFLLPLISWRRNTLPCTSTRV